VTTALIEAVVLARDSERRMFTNGAVAFDDGGRVAVVGPTAQARDAMGDSVADRRMHPARDRPRVRGLLSATRPRRGGWREDVRVAEALQRARPLVSGAACLHADHAGRQVGEEDGHLVAPELPRSMPTVAIFTVDAPLDQWL
jgi:hypothetical protein